MNIGSFFKEVITKNLLPTNTSLFQSQRFEPIYSKEPGAFTFFVGDRVLELFKNWGLGMNDLKKLPDRIFEKCRELGFLYSGPFYCAIELQDRNRSSEASMQLARIPLPKPMEGKPVSRAILIFADQFLNELEELKTGGALLTMMNGKQNEFARDGLSMIRTRIKTALSHEMVHLFATDEHQGDRLQSLGLDLLEVLTDSINVETFREDYHQASDLERLGFIEGAAYLVNLLDKEKQISGLNIPMKLMRKRAQEIIRECRGKLGIQGPH